jgi:hypothetical protein
MDSKNLIEKTRLYVEKELAGDGSGHDWWHVYRVWSIAKKSLKGKTQTQRLWNSLPYCTILRIGNLMMEMNRQGPRQAAAWLNRMESTQD